MSIYQRCKFFEQPFMYICDNRRVKEFCSYCLRRPESGQLLSCGACRHSRYCDKNCQRLGWAVHKAECGRLKRVFPNLPLTEVLFLGRGMDRLAFIAANGDVHKWQKDREFADLMGHQDEIRQDPEKMEHFERIYAKQALFMKEAMMSKEDYFDFWCRVWVNSHSIHNGTGLEIGMALDLGVSRYDHSCRPNCTLVFDGFRAVLRPLQGGFDAADWRKGRISYTDVGKSRYRRRQVLEKKWYFHCECERCSDPEDDRLTAIRCPNPKCGEPIIVDEESKATRTHCPKCKSITEPERILEAQKLMKELPESFPNAAGDAKAVAELKQLLEKTSALLHPENIYHCRLLTAVTHVDPDSAKNPEMHKLVYSNYRRCFPASDRHTGYQLLHVVRSLLEKGERDEATPYAYEAMTIFEVAFGLDHPYYLQTLALWTYLDNRDESKSIDDLLGLMNFNYNRPLDISSYLDTDNVPSGFPLTSPA